MKNHFPTELHAKTAKEITEYFSKIDNVNAVLLTCSCARGKATKDSCLDIAILFLPELEQNKRTDIIELWNKEHETNMIYKEFRKVGKFSHVDLEFIDGDFKEDYHEWTSGADEFELAIGNFIAYSVPLYKSDDYYDKLKSIWLPYYSESQRSKRLEMVKMYCLNNLHHIPLYVTNRKYPIAYDKWIKEQLIEILRMPNLYNELIKMMEYKKFESIEHKEKAEQLEILLSQYCKD